MSDGDGAAPTDNDTLERRRARLGRRLAASMYEALLLGAIIFAVGLLISLAVSPSTPPVAPSASRSTFTLPSLALRLAYSTAVFLACAVYTVGLWSGGRRSLPMRTWRLQLVTAQGHHPARTVAAFRYLAWWIGPGLALLLSVALRPYGHARWGLWLLAFNYAWALWDRRGDFLHDRLAGTHIVGDPRT